MAILTANYDENRDYLANFEPFVIDRLSSWPPEQPVRPQLLCKALSDAFSFPAIPLNTVTELRERARSQEYLKRDHDGKLYVNPKKLDDARDVLRHRTETLSHLEAVNHALREYATERLELIWSEEQADRALEAFVAEFGIEMESAKRDGGLSAPDDLPARQQLSIVHGFARHCLRENPANFDYLEEMVRGSMLTNVLYFKDLGTWTPQIEKLTVFLDTPIALRLLGLAPDELSAGAHQLMELLKTFDVPVRVFDHTVTEMIGVLEGVKNNLERARQRELDVRKLVNLNREVIEHLLQAGWGPGDVQAIIGSIDTRLNQAQIPIEPTPPYTRELGIDESGLEALLTENRFTKSQIAMDIKSVTAIHRLRRGQEVRSLSRATALFVTSNRGLVRLTNRFFRKQGVAGVVGQCISDLSLTTQLWLMGPSQNLPVPRKVLIAECFAALSPSQATWRKYLEKIEAKRAAGEVSDEDVKALVFTGLAQEGLLEATHNDPNLVDDDTPHVVLEHYKRVILEEAGQAGPKVAELTAENTELRARADSGQKKISKQEEELGQQRERLEGLETWRKSVDEVKAKRRAGVRVACGVGIAVALLAAGVTLVLKDVVSSPLAVSVVAFCVALTMMIATGWGFRKPLEWSMGVIVWLGAFLALFFGIYAVAAGVGSS
jgi:hypothetical protein